MGVTGDSLFWRLLVLFVPVNKFTILEGTPVRESPTSTRSMCAVLLVLVRVLVSWLVPVSYTHLTLPTKRIV